MERERERETDPLIKLYFERERERECVCLDLALSPSLARFRLSLFKECQNSVQAVQVYDHSMYICIRTSIATLANNILELSCVDMLFKLCIFIVLLTLKDASPLKSTKRRRRRRRRRRREANDVGDSFNFTANRSHVNQHLYQSSTRGSVIMSACLRVCLSADV